MDKPKYKDRLFQTNDIQAGQLIGVTDNVGDSHNYGGEFEVSTRLAKDFSILKSGYISTLR